jgi:hypothetical protein
LDAAGNPVMSFEIATVSLAVFHCNDANCSTRNESLDLGMFTGASSLALDARGYPVISFDASEETGFNDKLRLVRCGNANCTSANSTHILDNSAVIKARTPSLAIDPTGSPVIGYYDAANRDLKLARCWNASCFNSNIVSVVDSIGDVGNSPSLKLAAGGKPVIAHGDATIGTLKLVNCGDVNCINGNVSQVVDFVGAGYATKSSLALDGNGKPVIAYGTSSGQLRLARLIDNGITPPTITPAFTGTLGNNGWYTSNVTLSWTIANNGSAIITSSGCTLTTYTSDGAGGATCSATNAGGTTKQFVSIKRDTTKPFLAPTASPNPVLQYLSATGTPNAEDNLSGLASQSCSTPNTGTVGVFSLGCTATDKAGNTGTGTVSYTVISASQGIQNLIVRLNSMFINMAIKRDLTRDLLTAQSLVTVSKSGTLAQLDTFITKVQGRIGLIFSGDANTLITAANTLKASINAGP